MTIFDKKTSLRFIDSLSETSSFMQPIVRRGSGNSNKQSCDLDKHDGRHSDYLMYLLRYLSLSGYWLKSNVAAACLGGVE